MSDSQSLTDGWTIVHFAAGFLGKRAGLSLGSVLVISTIWEIFEYNGGYELFNNGTQDSKTNILGDTIAVLAGWYIG